MRNETHCKRYKVALSYSKTKLSGLFCNEVLVGAVGIENNTDRNLKDLEEMLGSAKTLKRNNGECKEILIGPSMAPRFFGTESPSRTVLATRKLMSVSGPNLAARMANRRQKALNKRESASSECR